MTYERTVGPSRAADHEPTHEEPTKREGGGRPMSPGPAGDATASGPAAVPAASAGSAPAAAVPGPVAPGSADPSSPETDSAPKRPCVVVAHASVGSGHRSAALAVAEAFEELRGTTFSDGLSVPEDLDVQVVDILDFARVHIDGDGCASMFTGITRPIYDLTWRFTFTGRLLWGGSTAFSKIMFPAFTQYLKDVEPIAVVCTHITAANSAVGARMALGRDFPIVCVPTDYETEGFWPHREGDAFCVATEAMAETLRPRLVPEHKIELTGIPTRKGYREHHDKMACRERFGLPQDKRVVLALAGAHLPRPYVHFRSALDEVLPWMCGYDGLHLAIVAGRDAEYAADLRRKVDEFGITNVSVHDYVSDMAGFMAAADVAVCKPGGLTTTECLCAQTPMVLIGQAYGQEKANVLTLTSLGAALHVTTARELIEVLRRFATKPLSVRSLLINARLVRRPQASVDVVHVTMRLVDERARNPRTHKKRFFNFYWGKKPAHTR